MKDLEIRRHIFHIIWGFIFIILIYFNLINSLIIFILIILFLIGSLLSKKIKIPIIYWFLKKLDRPEDIKSLPGKGSLFYLIGVFLVMILFPKDILIAAIIILAFGDSISFFIGKKYGKIKHPFSKKRFLEGTIIGAFIAFIGASLFVVYYEAALAAIIAMFIGDSDFKFKKFILDDNIIIPLISGIVIWLLRIY